MGSDINGAAALPGPRFGILRRLWHAPGCPAREGPTGRDRPADQRGGLRHTPARPPLVPVRPERDERLRRGRGRIWQAIAQYKAGYNPAVQAHLPSDFPEPSLHQVLEAIEAHQDQPWVDRMTEGFWAADDKNPAGDKEIADWPKEKRAGYFARMEGKKQGPVHEDDLAQLIGRSRCHLEKVGGDAGR